jgi:ribose transport system substrate-binding protein
MSPSQLFVGYSAPDLIDQLQRTWADDVCIDIKGVGGKCTITDANLSATKQVADIQDLIARGVNTLVINSVNSAAIVPVVKEANAKGIPVFTLDNGSMAGKVVTYVSVNNVESGSLAIQYCAKVHHGTGEVAELQGLPGAQVVIARNEGWVKGIKQYPGLKQVYDQYTNWSVSTAVADTQDVMEKYPNLSCIWTMDDVLAVGVVQVLEKLGKEHQVTVIGMGMESGGPQLIAKGLLAASLYMEPTKTAAAAVEAVLDYWAGKAVPNRIQVPLTFITHANVFDYPWNGT